MRFAVWGVLVILLAGCENSHIRRGDDLMKVGDFDGAVDEYGVASMETGRADVEQKQRAAERSAADVHFKRAMERKSAHDLDGAVAELEATVRLNPAQVQAKDYLDEARKKRDEVRGIVRGAKASLDGGDAIGAAAALEPVLAYAGGMPELLDLCNVARRRAAAELRDRAAKELAVGQIEAANADLDKATRLEWAAGGKPEGSALRTGSAAVAAPGRGVGLAAPEAAPPVGVASLDDYGRAAEEVKRITADLPHRGPGGGIAKAEDYAIPDEELARLDGAISRATAAKPAGERLPTWLAHGRICLRMAKDVAVAKRIDTARQRAEAGDPAGAWQDLLAARKLDPDASSAPENADAVGAVQRLVASRLVEIARRDLTGNLNELARLRARQAKELWPAAAGDANEVVARADAQASGQTVVVMPFQNYTSAEGLADRFYERLLRRLDKAGTARILRYDAYVKRKESGVVAPVVGLMKGDLVRLDVQDARDVKAAVDAKVAAYRRALDEAKRRLDASDSGPARVRARAAVEDAERSLARAERERAAALFAGAGRDETTSPVAGRLTVTLEARFQLHDPAVGRDIVAEPVVRMTEGAAGDRQALEERVIDDAVEPIATAIEARLYDVARADKAQANADPSRILDARIATLEHAKDAPPNAAAAAAVLEATGYSYVEKRTIPGQLKLD